jgi:hypothetical protein
MKQIHFGLSVLVVGIGFLQIVGHVCQSKTIKGLGAMTAASPLPIVFTTVRGLETFSSQFYFQITDKTGNKSEIEITPELYSKLKGPYNRRNVYGAAIAYGPILDSALLHSVLDYAIGRKVLIDEMKLSREDDYEIRITPKGTTKESILKSNGDVQ